MEKEFLFYFAYIWNIGDLIMFVDWRKSSEDKEIRYKLNDKVWNNYGTKNNITKMNSNQG